MKYKPRAKNINLTWSGYLARLDNNKLTLTSTSCMTVAKPPNRAIGSISSGYDPEKDQDPGAAAVIRDEEEVETAEMETDEKAEHEDDDEQGDGNAMET